MEGKKASEQKLTWVGDGPSFEGVDSWGHAVRVAGSADHDGSKPSDLLPISLAACTAYDVVVILQKQRQRLEGLEVNVSCEQDPEPPWAFRRIALHFVATGEVEPRRLEKAIELSERKYCAVAAAIRPAVEIALSSEVAPAS